MKRNYRRKGQRGFTLIELLAVMAILAVLVGVVAPAVTGTRDASVDAQVLQDATQVRSAASDYYGDVNEAEVVTPHTVITTALMPAAIEHVETSTTLYTGAGAMHVTMPLRYALRDGDIANVISITSTNPGDNPTAKSYMVATRQLFVVGIVVGIEGGAPETRTLTVTYYGSAPAVVTATQKTSNRWPERFISQQVAADGAVVIAPENVVAIGSGYAGVIPTAPANNIDEVVLLDKDGHSIDGSTLLTRYTAIDLKALTDSGALQEAPAGSAFASDGIPNFLWLFVKTSSATDRSDDNREVAVFKLVKVEQLEGQAATMELVNATDGTVNSQAASHADRAKVTYERVF